MMPSSSKAATWSQPGSRLSNAIEERAALCTGEATFADAALFYVLFWAVDRVKLEVPSARARALWQVEVERRSTTRICRRGDCAMTVAPSRQRRRIGGHSGRIRYRSCRRRTGRPRTDILE